MMTSHPSASSRTAACCTRCRNALPTTRYMYVDAFELLLSCCKYSKYNLSCWAIIKMTVCYSEWLTMSFPEVTEWKWTLTTLRFSSLTGHDFRKSPSFSVLCRSEGGDARMLASIIHASVFYNAIRSTVCSGLTQINSHTLLLALFSVVLEIGQGPCL